MSSGMHEVLRLTSGTPDQYRETGRFGRPLHMFHAQIVEVAGRALGPEAASLFAEPLIDERTGRIDWYAAAAEGEAPRPYADLPPEEQAALRQRLGGLIDRLERLAAAEEATQVPGRQQMAAILRAALAVPEDDRVFAIGGRPVVAFWGYTRDGEVTELVDLVKIRAQAEPPPPPPPPAAVAAAVASEPPPAPPGVAQPWLDSLLGVVPAWILYGLAGVTLLAALALGLASWLGWWPPAIGQAGAEATPVPQSAFAAARAEEDALRRHLQTLFMQLERQRAACLPPHAGATPSPARPTPAPPPPAEPPNSQQPEPEPATPGDRASENVTPPGRDLVIPDGAEDNQDLGFLEGRWDSRSGIFNTRTREPVTMTITVDDQGRATAVIQEKSGNKCRSTTTARFDGGDLVFPFTDPLRCTDGSHYDGVTIRCTPQAGRAAACHGEHNGGGNFDVRMVRKGSNTR